MSENAEKNDDKAELPGQQGTANANSGIPEEKRLRDLDEFRIRYNILVHEDYANHYRNLDKACSFLSITLGVVAIFSLAFPKLAVPLAVVSAISLAFSFLAINYEFGKRAGEYSNAAMLYNSMLVRIRSARTAKEREAVEREYANLDVPGKIDEVTQMDAQCRAFLQVGILEPSDIAKIGWWTYHTRFLLPHHGIDALTESGKKKIFGKE